MSKRLIHTALLCEAQSIIEFYKLTQDNSVENKSIKIYSNDELVVLVGGIGKENTIQALEYVFAHYDISKAFNIGIAGCSDSSVKIGTLFCTNKFLPSINFAPITTVDEPLESDESLETLLVDMEAQYFIYECKKHITDIYVFKVVSDYLEAKIPKKAFVLELIKDSFATWKKYI